MACVAQPEGQEAKDLEPLCHCCCHCFSTRPSPLVVKPRLHLAEPVARLLVAAALVLAGVLSSAAARPPRTHLPLPPPSTSTTTTTQARQAKVSTPPKLVPLMPVLPSPDVYCPPLVLACVCESSSQPLPASRNLVVYDRKQAPSTEAWVTTFAL